MLLYLQKCLEHAAGVTEEDRIKNCILPSVAQYVEKLLADVHSDGKDNLVLIFSRCKFSVGITSRLNVAYRIYSIKRPGRLLNFWTLRVIVRLFEAGRLLTFHHFQKVESLFCNKT